MVTNATKRKAPTARQIVQDQREQKEFIAERCTCRPLSAEHKGQIADQDEQQFIPAPADLNIRLRMYLEPLLSHVTLVSILLLHISQVEPLPLVTEAGLQQKPRYLHAPAGFLGQLMIKIRRVIRCDDQILLHPEAGAVFVLSNVDRQGVYRVLERITHSLDLLQAKTVVPPLTRETKILLGSGTYPEQGATLEELLYHAGNIVYQQSLRPAITPLAWNHYPRAEKDSQLCSREPAHIPFMQLPKELPKRLKQLIPYKLAYDLRCAPVGREHHCLTIAMADPSDSKALCHLAEVTGMTIFPVSCEEEALNALLEKIW
jgi:hypothetical protein